MKKYLIDTHILLWLTAEPHKLSNISKEIILNIENAIYVSIMSFWEVAIKTSIGKLEFYTTIEELTNKTLEKNIEIITPNIQTIAKIQIMPFYKIQNIEHRDPFDRMIIAQAITENIPIISADTKFDLYPEIQRIW